MPKKKVKFVSYNRENLNRENLLWILAGEAELSNIKEFDPTVEVMKRFVVQGGIIKFKPAKQCII